MTYYLVVTYSKYYKVLLEYIYVKLNNWIKVAILGVSLIEIGYFGNQIYKNAPKKKTEIVSENLLLNDNDSIAFVTYKDREEGIKDIRKLLAESPYEEAWIYLPEHKIWYETGINSNFEKDSLGHIISSVQVDYKSIKKFLKKYDVKEIEFWHYHPPLELMYKKAKEIKPIELKLFSKKDALETRKKLRETFSNFDNSSTSISDIKSMVWRELNKNLGGKYELTSKVASGPGIMGYFLSDNGIDHYHKLNKVSKFFNLKLKYDDFLQDAQITKSDTLISVKNENMVVKFRPHKNSLEGKFVSKNK